MASHLKKIQTFYLWNYFKAIGVCIMLPWWSLWPTVRSLFQFTHPSWSVIQWSQTETEALKQRHDQDTDLIALDCSSMSLVEFNSSSLEMAAPTVSGDLLHQSEVKKMPHRHLHKPTWWRISSTDFSSSQMTFLCLGKLTKANEPIVRIQFKQFKARFGKHWHPFVSIWQT